MTCKVITCNNKVYAKEHCSRHYQHLLTYGKVRLTRHDKRPGVEKKGCYLLPLGVEAKDGYAKVDKAFAYLDKHNWYRHHAGGANTVIDGVITTMESLIVNRPAGMVIDHINHDRLDNRLVNLRVCTRMENRRNSRKPKHNSLGYKGIKKYRSRYQAVVGYNGSYVIAGMFATPEEAARAYDKKALELHGNFACLNFPKEILWQ